MKSIAEIASSEQIALYNQAFVAVVIRSGVAGYSKSGRNMPPELAFLLVPLALHLPTRESLPIHSSTQMQKWIREHPLHLVKLEIRVLAMKQFVGAGLRFGTRHGVIRSVDGQLAAGGLRRKPRGFSKFETTEVRDCVRKASFLGRWFARQPDEATLLAMWGLRP